MSESVSICVIGSGYVGLVAALCFAEIGHNVVCVDRDETRVDLLRRGHAPIFEQHVPELLGKHLNKSVEFTTELGAAVDRSKAIFIAVGTPQDETGAADLSYVEAVVSEIARTLQDYKVIIEKSTVPVYTNEWIRRVLYRHGIEPDQFDVASNPEFLREGAAVSDFLHPDRIVIGTSSDRAAKLLQQIYAPLTTGAYYAQNDAIAGPCSTVNPAKLLATSAQSAEIIKHASNAFLAMKISFINAVANLAEIVGADIEDIAAGMGMDNRIGSRFLRAGIGYGGSCFPKDVAAFYWVAEQQGLNFALLEDIRRINDTQREVFFNKVRSALWTLRGKRLAALGLAFKAETDDIRESPAIEIIRKLLDAGAKVRAYDPAATVRAKETLPTSGAMSYAEDVYQAADGADAALIFTDWKQFAEIDLERLKRALKFPIVVDGRNIFKPEVMAAHGFTYVSIGRPTVFSGQQGGAKNVLG